MSRTDMTGLARLATMAGLAALLLAATPAFAQQWSHTGPQGAKTRTYDGATKTYSVDRTGPQGGSTHSTLQCSRDGAVKCDKDYSATGANGKTVSGTRHTRYGKERGHVVNTVTKPSGNKTKVVHPNYRYNRKN